jgi:hypothetical protein
VQAERSGGYAEKRPYVVRAATVRQIQQAFVASEASGVLELDGQDMSGFGCMAVVGKLIGVQLGEEELYRVTLDDGTGRLTGTCETTLGGG